MTGNDDGAWFGQRSYGARNLPISWQGWAVTILYGVGAFLCFFLPALWKVQRSDAVSIAAFVLLTIPFGYLCIRKSRRGVGRQAPKD